MLQLLPRAALSSATRTRAVTGAVNCATSWAATRALQPRAARVVGRALTAGALGLAAFAPAASAQAPTTVTGAVRTEAGAPLPRVSVVLPSLGLGAETNAQGRYTIVVPGVRARGQSAELSARLIGYRLMSATITLTAGATVAQDFTLVTNPLRLTEVVVTGSGTSTTREKLGTAVSSVASAEIRKSAEVNVVNALAQKAPGVEITSQSGDPGAGSGIVIRGFKTIQGSGQPLFVVDGVPIDNSVSVTDASDNGFAYANRALDLNPADVESVEVLKGPAAAALYGLRAANGVIQITTRAGRAGTTRYQLSSNTNFDEVNRTVPLQTAFGRGLGNVTPTCVPDQNCQLRSWGPRLTAGTPTYDHFAELFHTGTTYDNTLQVSGGDAQRSFFLSGGNLDQKGISRGPNSDLARRTLRLRATQALGDRVRVGGNFNYSDLAQKAVQKGNNLNGLLLGATRQPPEYNPFPYITEQGLQRCWSLPDPRTPASSCIFDSGLWVQNEPRNRSDVGRTIGSFDVNYDPASWLKVSYTLGADFFNERRLEGLPPFSSGDALTGQLYQGSYTNRQVDHNLLATLGRQLTPRWNTSLTLGQNLNWRSVRQQQVKGVGFNDPGLYTLNNIITTNLTPQNFQSNVNIAGYFGEAKLDYGDYAYLAGRLRADQSSALSRKNRTGYFPGASLALNITNMLGLRDPKGVLGYLKARGAYGVAGRSPDAYDILTNYSSKAAAFAYGQGANNTGLGGNPGLVAGATRGLEDLHFERTAEGEGGLDFGLLNQRVDGSVSYYSQATRDLIFAVAVPASTGFSRAIQNGGRVKNAGVEVQVNARPLELQHVGFDVGLNFTRNRNRLVDLQGSEFQFLPGGFGNSAAVRGQPLGTFFFTDFARCRYDIPDADNAQTDAGGAAVDLNALCRAAKAPNGALYVGADGFPITDPQNRVSGNPNPDWQAGVRLGARLYRRVNLSALVDVRRGGDVWNGTRAALQSYGTSKYTENRAICTGRGAAQVCTGNEQVFGSNGWYDGAVVGPGAGKAVPIGENWWRGPSAAGPGIGNNFNGPSAQFVEDGSFTRLREVSVAYTFDGARLRGLTGLSSADVRLAGRNLALWTKYKGVDPETNLQGPIGAGRGQDYFNNPQTRSWVVNVTLNR